ncbi:glycogen synthase [Candidatus Falkowbacteria bacterium]|nr:glycogen synthase [Candidatus Falkowbacteria bacterium]
MKKIKVAYLGAELTPLAKVGGLGDVMGALPKAMKKLNVDARVFLPFYGSIDRNSVELVLVVENLVVNSAFPAVNVWQAVLPGSDVILYLLEHPMYAGTEIYSNEELVGKGLKMGAAERFVFFCQAALAAMLKVKYIPDIVHLNDWHTAGFLPYLEELKNQEAAFKKVKTVYTIHNLANQGVTPVQEVDLPSIELVKRATFDGNINFMAMGILGADIVNTVSETYAKEILTSEQGAGLEKILYLRKDVLCGVVNGIDQELFNPLTDKFLVKNFDIDSIEDAINNKTELQKEVGLPINQEKMLAGLVSRFVGQKGLDLISENMFELDMQFVFLGSGSQEIEERLLAISSKYPDKFKVVLGFDAGLAQRIYAGSDLFLMPSRFEPCGLGQMIAMRYGSLPLVRKTGGLADTVSGRIGFIFNNYDSKELFLSIKKALKLYTSDKLNWKKRQQKAMSLDFSWKKSAKKYKILYKKLLTLS